MIASADPYHSTVNPDCFHEFDDCTVGDNIEDGNWTVGTSFEGRELSLCATCEDMKTKGGSSLAEKFRKALKK